MTPVKAPKVRGKAPKVKPGPAAPSAVRRGAEAAAELRRHGHPILRIGFKPRDALAQFSPEFAAARTWFDLRLRMSRAWPQADPQQSAVRSAREGVEQALEAMTDEEFERSARWLRDTVGDVPHARDRTAFVDAIRKQFDDELPPPSKLQPSTARPRATAFEQVQSLGEQVGEVAAATRTFELACVDADAATVRAAGRSLQDLIEKHGKVAGLDWKARHRAKRAIETVVRSFERQAPTEAGAAAIAAFNRAHRALKADHPFFSLYRRLQSWLDDADFDRLGAAVARLPPMKGGLSKEAAAAAASWRISSIKGVLGELIGRKGPYRRVFDEHLGLARSFADGTEGKAWKVYVPRTPIRALNKKGALALFYDDAILLVDESRSRVAIAFSAQFKAGDVASLKVLEQLDSDELREGLGKLLVDGKLYDIDRQVVVTERVIVTTKLGMLDEFPEPTGGPPKLATPKATAAAIGTKDVQFVPMPVDPDDLFALATFLLRAAEKILAP
jgi:hypothetical protein